MAGDPYPFPPGPCCHQPNLAFTPPAIVPDLRTYLAAHAPPKPDGYSCHLFSSETMQHAEWAVRYADALIARLAQSP